MLRQFSRRGFKICVPREFEGVNRYFYLFITDLFKRLINTVLDFVHDLIAFSTFMK